MWGKPERSVPCAPSAAGKSASTRDSRLVLGSSSFFKSQLCHLEGGRAPRSQHLTRLVVKVQCKQGPSVSVTVRKILRGSITGSPQCYHTERLKLPASAAWVPS